MAGRDTSHLGFPTPTLGAPTGFIENFGSSFTTQRKTESAFGLTVDYMDALRESLEQAQTATGETYDLDTSLGSLSTIIDRELGLGVSALPKFVKEYEAFEAVNEQIAEAKKLHPNLKTPKEVLEEQIELRSDIIDRQALISARQTWGGWFGEFLGGMAGSFDPRRDPVNVATIFMPLGAGKSILVNMFREALANAAVEGLQQAILVGPRKQALEEPTDWLTNTLYAGLGAAAFRGVLEAAAPFVKGAYRRAQGSLDPQGRGRAFAQELEGLIDTTELGTPAQARERAARGVLPDSYERDVALSAAELDDYFFRVSGLPDTYNGQQVLNAIFEQQLRTFEGITDTPPFYNLTPESRPLVPVTTRLEGTSRLEPEVEAELESLRQQLIDLEDATAAVDRLGATQTVEDALDAFDLITPEQRERLEQLNRTIAEGADEEIPPPEVVRAQVERDEIIESIPEGELQRAQRELDLDLRLAKANNLERMARIRRRIDEINEDAGFTGRPEEVVTVQKPDLTSRVHEIRAEIDDFNAEQLVDDFVETIKTGATREEPEVTAKTVKDLEKDFGVEKGKLRVRDVEDWWNSTLSVALLRGDNVEVTIDGKTYKIDKLTRSGAHTTDGRYVFVKTFMNDPEATVQITQSGTIGGQGPVARTIPDKMTKEMREDLKMLGFTEETIDVISPDEAWGILHRTEPTSEKYDAIDVGLERPIRATTEVADPELEKITNVRELRDSILADEEAFMQAKICASVGESNG